MTVGVPTIRFPRNVVLSALCVVGATGLASAQQVVSPVSPGVTVPPPIVQTVDTKRAAEIKGVYIFNFGRYVTWPANSELPQNEFRVGVIGTTRAIKTLDILVKRKKNVRDRRTGKKLPLRVKKFKSIDDYRPCHILIIPPTVSAEQREKIKKRFANKPVLLVGESPGFAQAGGTAGFVMVNGGIKFDLNVADAKRKGLKFDAKFMKMANSVVQRIEP